jgi:hypothetical protein
MVGEIDGRAWPCLVCVESLVEVDGWPVLAVRVDSPEEILVMASPRIVMVMPVGFTDLVGSVHQGRVMKTLFAQFSSLGPSFGSRLQFGERMASC